MSEILVNTIKKADGTGGLTVPAETGTVLTSVSSTVTDLQDLGKGFSAYPGSTSISNSTATKINFTNEEYDDFSAYTASTSTFVVPHTGTYLVNVSLRIAPGSNQARMEFAIYVGGSLYRCLGINQQNVNDMQADTSRVMRFTQNDSVTIYLHQNSGSSLDVTTQSNFGSSGQTGQGHWQITLLRKG